MTCRHEDELWPCPVCRDADRECLVRDEGDEQCGTPGCACMEDG